MKTFRFGVFEFNAGTAQLRRDGVPVRLQAQPAQVLRVLLENAGTVVSRETLRDAVWGNQTFVDYDRNLNYCLTQIRSAIADSADSPRFVRTHPKRGYEFIAPVTMVCEAIPAARPLHAKRVALLATSAVILLAGVLLAIRGLQPAPKPVTIAVFRFDNETSDPAMTQMADRVTDELVAEMTTRGGAAYAIIGNAEALRRPRAERNLKQIAAELKADYVMIGQVQPGAPIRVLGHLIRGADQKHLWVARVDETLPPPEIARRISSEMLQKLASQDRAKR